MDYEKLYSDFKGIFPQYADRMDMLAKDANADENDGIHIMFSFVVVPFVITLLNEDSDVQIKKAFDFFERMASSDDVSVTEVLEFSVIENLMSSENIIFEKSKEYMGQEMLKCLKTVSAYMSVGE